MIEVLRPTVSGPDAIARAAGGPWLGTLSGAPGPMLNGQMEAAAGGIRLAAASANVGTVLVVPAGTDHRDAEEVASVLGVAPDEGSEPDPSLLEPVPGGARAVVSYDNANSGGIVVVAPDSIRRRDLAAVHHWSAATHWPVLGVVLYPHGWLARARHRAAQSANGNGNGKANGNGNGKANANGNGRKEHIPTA